MTGSFALHFSRLDNFPQKKHIFTMYCNKAQQPQQKNIKATEAYIKKKYPNEKFISEILQLRSPNKYSKGLVIPENVKVAESRMPINAAQRNVLRKELLQAEILAKKGISVFLIPEHGGYGERIKDAVVNGELFEFRSITGNARTLEWEFGAAKEKGNDTNVFITIESDISRDEARRRIGMVLKRHPEYTGKIVISFQAGDN